MGNKSRAIYFQYQNVVDHTYLSTLHKLNLALMQQFHIRYLVTKDGGSAGGFAEKAQAAAQSGAALVVLRRPEECGEPAEEILQRCRELL